MSIYGAIGRALPLLLTLALLAACDEQTGGQTGDGGGTGGTAQSGGGQTDDGGPSKRDVANAGRTDACIVIVTLDEVYERPEYVQTDVLTGIVAEWRQQNGGLALERADFVGQYGVYEWCEPCSTAREKTQRLLAAYKSKLTPEQQQKTPSVALWERSPTKEELTEGIIPELNHLDIRPMQAEGDDLPPTFACP